MRRQFIILTALLALAFAFAAPMSAPRRAFAQATPVATPSPSLCDANSACFVFSPADASGPSAVDLYIDSKLAASNVKLMDSSALITVAPGPHWLQIPSTGKAASTATITASMSFEAGTVADLVLRDVSGGTKLTLFKLDPSTPAPGASRSRIVNVWPGLGTIDVELGDPGDKTGGALDVSFSGIHQDAASSYAETGVFSDLAALNIFAAGSADLKAAPALRPCPANSLCSYILIGPVGKSKTIDYALAVFPV